MDITNVLSVDPQGLNAVQEKFYRENGFIDENGDFKSVFESALNMVNETNDFQNQAESSMIQFALGESDNLHDLLIAQEKANVALQYTVAVKDKIIDAYREIMQMQI